MTIDAKPARLLVVEDEVIIARDLQDSLEELGYEVPDIASSGGEALHLAATLQPDLVLMDVNLGAASRDGVETARELRERLDLPVIYLTAYTDPATLARARATAPLGYLTKPFERRELHATIQMALVKRQLDQQLRQSESWYSTSLSCIGDGVIATDDTGAIRFVNPVAETLTGWSHTEALGKPLREVLSLFDAKTSAERPALVERVLAEKRTVILEDNTLLRSRSGNFIPVDDSAAPIRDGRDGRTLGVVIVFRDVSEKLKVAAELERARRLESLGTLAGGLAHDLNNILAIIAGNASLASLPDNPPDVHARAFARIEAAVHRAKAITTDFLTFSKGGEPIRRSTDLRALLTEEIHLLLEDDRSASSCRYELEIAPDLWMAEVDGDQIRRVVENVVRNAVQALPPTDGRITVRARNCTPEELADAPAGGPAGAARFVKLEVIDNGCGIAPENLGHVCDPYFTTRTHGSGLGLSVCHAIVRKHDGLLRISSVVGEGTTVAIYLPATPPSSSLPPPSRPPVATAPQTSPGSAASGASAGDASGVAGGGFGLRVLVMDDEPLLRELLSRMFKCLGHHAETAATGEEALRRFTDAAAAQAPFDVVCIDLVNKLGMGGEETIAALRKINHDVIALVCSGYSDHPIMANYRSYGFHGCVPKPVRLEDLSVGLRQAIVG